MRPNGVGIWSLELREVEDSELAEAAAEVETLGFTALWLPRYRGDPPSPSLTAAVAATDEIAIVTAILSIWAYEAQDVAELRARLNEESGGRFLLGLGVSHPQFVDAVEAGRYRKPLSKMVEYLDRLASADPPVPADGMLLAALGPKMMRLSAERTAGAHPYATPPEHTRVGREIMGPDGWLAPHQTVLFETDPAGARDIGRVFVGSRLAMPNYASNFRRLGYGEEDMADGGSDRLVDDIVAWGDDDAIAARVQAHLDAGADHVAVQVLGGEPDVPPRELWSRVASVLGVTR